MKKERGKQQNLDEKLSTDSKKGLLFGMPIGLKDNMVTKGLRTTCASKILENFNPIYDATVVQKLQQAETVTIGKLNMDEFAMGSSNENSHFQKTRNPWDLERVPGGSSGGSAASVAAGEVLFSWFRYRWFDPSASSFLRCGRNKANIWSCISFRSVAFASSLDQIGPITRTVEDNAYLLQAISGLRSDGLDISECRYTKLCTCVNRRCKGLKIAVPKEYLR